MFLLDNSAFALARVCFIEKANKDEAFSIHEIAYEVPKKRKQTPFVQIMMLLGTFLLMISGWVVVYVQQVTGQYLPHHIIVQFDDGLQTDLGSYSGMYHLDNDPSKHEFARIEYVETRAANRERAGIFAYCTRRSEWTFRSEGKVLATTSRQDLPGL